MISLLARDALDLVQRTPTAAHLWRRLASMLRTTDVASCAAMLDEMAQWQFDHPAAQWLHYSAMAGLTLQPHWQTRQAALAGAHSAPGALAALLQLNWYYALTNGGAHDGFTRRLQVIDGVHLQRLLARQLGPDDPAPPARPGQRPLRVALYTPDLADRRHGGTVFTLNMLSLLTRQAVVVRAFCGQEMSSPDMEAYCGSDVVVPPALDAAALTLHVPGSLDVKLGHTELSLAPRLTAVLQEIHRFEPDLVLFVGFLSPLVYRLYERYPVLGLSLHALTPMVPLDVWLSPQEGAPVQRWPGLPVPAVAPFPCRFWPTAAPQPRSRAELDVPDDALVLLTSGNRLHVEIPEQWGAAMVALLDAHPGAYWVLIGVPEAQALDGIGAHPRIRRLALQERLEPWLALADLYANPPRMGGGGSVAMAMQQGLAVAAYAHTDGGDKTGPWAASSQAAYLDLLGSWLRDPHARRAAAQAMRQRHAEVLDMSGEQAGQRLTVALQLAIEQFHRRQEESDA